MKTAAVSSVSRDLSSFVQNNPQETAMSQTAIVALTVIGTLATITIGLWSKKLISKCWQDYRKQAEYNRNVQAFMSYSKKQEITYTQIVLFSVGISVTCWACVIFKQWACSEGPWGNITNLNVSQSLPIKTDDVKKVAVTILNLPKCYLNQTPKVEVIKFLPGNSTLNATVNATINSTAGFFGIDFRIWKGYARDLYTNFSFQNVVSSNIPKVDVGSYFDFKSITTSISFYAMNVVTWARKNICELFALNNC